MMHQVIGIRLVNEKTWRKYSPATEMILTKPGRRLFPLLEYQVSGLNPKEFYTFELRMERCDDIKYKFGNGEWQEAGKGEPRVVNNSICHSDGFRSGQHWMDRTVSFSECKITNNPAETKPTHIVLQSMHKYIPVLSICRMNSSPSEPENIGNFSFHFTAFYAVTNYNNPEIVCLKKENNKYASVFFPKENRGRCQTDLPDAPNDNTPIATMPRLEYGFVYQYPFAAPFTPSGDFMVAIGMDQGVNDLQQYQPRSFYQQNGPQYNPALQQQHQQPHLQLQHNQVQYRADNYYDTFEIENFNAAHRLNPQYPQHIRIPPSVTLHLNPPQQYDDDFQIETLLQM